MRCTSCGGKGFIEGWQAVSASWTPSLQQCPKRCNIKGYSDEVQLRTREGYVTETPVLQAKPQTILRKPAQVIRLHFHKDETV